MTDRDVAEFSSNFHDQIRAEALAIDALREHIFVRKTGEILEEYGEIEAFVPSPHQGRGVKVDGYSYDDEFRDFTLIVSHYVDEKKLDSAKVSNTEIDRAFKKAISFFTGCLDGLASSIEISNEAHELARLLQEEKADIRNVKIVLVTDGITKKRPADVEEQNGLGITKVIWDIERICHFSRTGEREKIAMDFSEYLGAPLPCVELENENDIYSTYLGFVPGEVLADMYQLHGTRMLDMNVRVFLSARGNVNKGIRKTILEEPEMFCAYNNGITVFARNIELENGNGGLGLLRAEDFQIINGGQTTASLYHTRRKDKADLSKITVQMKLTVIKDETKTLELVPRISEYSNTQNKVQMADLAANQAPHPEIQAISNQKPAPDPTGGAKQTYWFYERARGSYEESRNLQAKTPAQKKIYDELRPKNQKFDKLKFGKVWNAYLRLPHVVSLGAQKSFGRFNAWLQEQEGEEWYAFFRKTVALLVMWNTMERMVRRNKYQGYHHNIIAYTLAWFFQLTDSRIDLDKLWEKQEMTELMENTLEEMSVIVNDHIRDTEKNVTEYCKKEECWEKLKERSFELPYEIKDEFIDGTTSPEYESTITSEKEAIEFCKNKGGDAWFALSKWLKERNFMAPRERSQCYNMGRILTQSREPSPALSYVCSRIWPQAEARGWTGVVEEEPEE